MQKLIENAIRKSLNRHLVQHVNVLPDKRCRVDIMVEEATNEILKLVVQPDVNGELPSDYEPYFFWCDVDGCENEGRSGGMAWRDTGYWTVCYKHSQMHREGKEQPKMKQTAIDKEKTRKPDGTLP